MKRTGRLGGTAHDDVIKMVAEVEVGQPEFVRLAAFLRPVCLQEDGVDSVPARVVAVDTFSSQFKGVTKRTTRTVILIES